MSHGIISLAYFVTKCGAMSRNRPAAVADLSDDSDGERAVVPLAVRALSESSSDHEVELAEIGQRRKKRRRSAHGVPPRLRLVDQSAISRLLQRKCKSCRRCCLRDIETDAERYEELVKFRETWVSIHKLDPDKIVAWRYSQSLTVAMLLQRRSSTSWWPPLQTVGSSACSGSLTTFPSAAGVGSLCMGLDAQLHISFSWNSLGPLLVAWLRPGSQRLSRLWEAARSGATSPPADLRFLTKPKSLTCGSGSTAEVASFLQSLYESVAETLPDVVDDGLVPWLCLFAPPFGALSINI